MDCARCNAFGYITVTICPGHVTWPHCVQCDGKGYIDDDSQIIGHTVAGEALRITDVTRKGNPR